MNLFPIDLGVIVDPRPLLIHLERPFSAFDALDSSPKDVLVAGLRGPSEYWIALALSWVEQGAPIDRELVELLEAIATKQYLSQQVRHKAFAMARRWSRSNQST